MAARPSCHNCVYACWDLCQAMQSFSSGFPHRPRCANQPAAPSIMRPTPLGRVCVNYRARPKKPEGDNVKAIPLADGFYAYVDAADYEWLNQYTWRLYGGGYAARMSGGKTIFMHREIMQPPKGMVVDHVDGNKANNCRFNLRNCTPQQNRRNVGKHKKASSSFKGVWFVKRLRKWCAAVHVARKNIYLGYFADEIEAARAYDRTAVQHYGEFARLNFPEEWPPQRRAEMAKEHEKAEGKRQKATRRDDACVARTRKEQEHGGRKRRPENEGQRAGRRTRSPATTAKGSKRATRDAQRKTSKSKRTRGRTTGHRSRATAAKPRATRDARRATRQRVARRTSA